MILAGLGLALTALLVGILVAKRDRPAPERPTAQPSAAGDTAPSKPRLRTVLTRTGNPPGSSLPSPGSSPKAATGANTGQAPDYVPGQLLVKFEHGISARRAEAVVSGAGGDVEQQVGEIDVSVVDVPAAETRGALAELRAAPGVEYVERDVAVQKFDTVPNDSLWSTQWGPALVHAPRAWDAAKGSANIVIAVLDTGAALDHPDLRGRFVSGFDFVSNDADPSDDEGHGTAAAGVIGASTNNGEGQAGLCWSCSLMPIKVLDEAGSGDTAAVAAGIVWAADNGARVISMSLGGEGTTQTLADAVEYAASKRIILVAAAGNSGSASQTYPAAYPQVLSVAGTNESDGLYSWSNHGPWVQLAAPGCNTAPYLGGTYVNFCGTSAATPLVAGLVGLALSAKPGATKAEVEQALRGTAASLQGAVQYGRVDASAALAALGVHPPAARPPAAPPPAVANPETSASLRGSLTGRARARRHLRILDRGNVAAELTFTGSRTLTLTLVDAEDAVVARVTGASPLRLATTVEEDGAYEFVVSRRKGKARAGYSLRAPGEAE